MKDFPIMVHIPGGAFLMGTTEGEGSPSESPQHEVTVATFAMGQFPVTQAQWRAVAALPKIARELDPEPSYFKGNNRPVEQVSWDDAVEFCARMSAHASREYRLPSEAEWEYACRARTTTPYHFGEALTTELANYNGNYTYGDGPKGEYREQTTDVGSFPANAFGLHDMHGNVWEWCLDHFHDDYDGAPTDGSAWCGRYHQSANRILRGGSWLINPRYCRSAYRCYHSPVIRLNNVGFRVVCSAPSAFQ